MKTLRDAIRSRDFVVTAEIFLRPESDARSIAAQCALLREHVDAIVLTDNQYGQMHLSPLAAASVLLENDVDPVVQLSCRNRNRISLASELIGAAVMGVTSLLLIRGEKVPDNFQPRPKAVMDLTAKDLIAMAAKMNADEDLAAFSDMLIGGLVTPHGPKPGWVPRKLSEKVDAGVRFVLTHMCVDTDLLRAYMKHLVASGLTRQAHVIATTAALASPDDANWLKENRPNVMVPDAITRRLEHAASPEREGIEICAEQLQEMQEIPGLGGANIVATGNLASIVEAVELAGLSRT